MDSPAAATAPPSLDETLMRAGAGFGIRFAARAADLVYLVLLSALTGIFAGLVFGIMDALGRMPPGWVEHMEAESYHMYGFGLLGSFLYYAFSEGICGTTIGKLLCKLSVVQTDGRPCTLPAAFKRDLAYHWDALFLGLVAYMAMKDSPTQQRYGDRWADTVVVKKALYAPDPGYPAWRFPAGIIVGSLFWMLCQFTGLLLKVR